MYYVCAYAHTVARPKVKKNARFRPYGAIRFKHILIIARI